MTLLWYVYIYRTIPTKIYVGNLPETCRRQDLLESFEKYGKVTECDIVRNYAFVVRICQFNMCGNIVHILRWNLVI